MSLGSDRSGRTGAAAVVLGARAATRRRRRRRRIAVVAWTLLALVAGAGGATAGLLAAPIDFTEPPPAKSALLLDAQGRLVATIRAPERREPATTEQIPLVMRQAMISAEDARFFEHGGVDPLALVRAAYNDVTGGDLQGGSTITQQYVKNVFVGNDKTVMRKLREAALSVRLERQLSKDEILTRYLNDLYLGNGVYGVQAASRYYFGIDVERLSLAQASMLAGIAPAPSLYNPVRNLDAARTRQLYTLNRMSAAGFISPQEASQAYREPPMIVQAAPEGDLPTIAPEFRDLVRTRLARELAKGRTQEAAEDLLFRGGLRITTTLDLDLQSAVVQALGEVLDDPDDPQAAVVAIDPRSGDIKALTTRFDATVAGERVQGYSEGGFNLATQARRSSGSTIKPFTLAAALESGRSVTDREFAPSCASIPNPGGTPDPYTPCNAEPSERGTYTLAKAMELSVNTIYAPLAVDVGMQKVMDLAGAAGLAPQENLKAGNLSSALGVEVTPLSVAAGYSTLVNHGVAHDPRTLLQVRVGGDGSAGAGDLVLAEPAEPEGRQVVAAPVADAVTDVLEQVVARGTGTAARQAFPVYGKTGTNGEKDAWFVGCTRELCLATWMGYDDNRSMNGVQGVRQVYGGTLPADVFARTLALYREITAAEPVEAVLDLGRAPTPSATPSRRPAAPLPSASPTPDAERSPAAPSPSPSRPAASPLPPVEPPAPSQPAPAPAQSTRAPASSPPPPSPSPRQPSPTPSPSRIGLPGG